MQREAFIWDGIEHWHGPDLMDTVALLSSEDEAASFLEAYVEASATEDDAKHNVVYMCKIIEDGAETLELFNLGNFSPPAVPEPRQWWNNSSMGVKT